MPAARISPGVFGDLVDPGAIVGTLTPAAGQGVGATGLPVCAVGSHDTASAVVGVPLTGPDAAYISCGTWGLVGVELDKPVVTPESGPRTSPTRAASTAGCGS